MATWHSKPFTICFLIFLPSLITPTSPVKQLEFVDWSPPTHFTLICCCLPINIFGVPFLNQVTASSLFINAHLKIQPLRIVMGQHRCSCVWPVLNPSLPISMDFSTPQAWCKWVFSPQWLQYCYFFKDLNIFLLTTLQKRIHCQIKLM